MEKILLVEDNSDLREMLVMRLECEGYEIDEAENGAVGVEKALAGSFDIILMDMHMPVMDGHEAVRTLRQKHSYTGLIVAVTASVMQSDTNKVTNSGCDDCISKPIGDDFEQRVAATLKKKGGQP